MYCLSSGLRTNISAGGCQSGDSCLLWMSHALPDKAFPADAHAIANGLSGIVDEVEKMTGRIDDDRSRRLVRRVGDDLAGEDGIRPSLSVPRIVLMPALVVPPTQAASCRSAAYIKTPHDPHLPAGKTPEPDFHNDILNQNGSDEYRPVP